MSVSALAGILRRLRRDLAEKATFRTGTVVESIDATHVLVDIGKPVPAFVSPIFLPAVVVGAPVMVRLQGSHYDVVDAPQSPATLIPTATLAALVALLPVAGGNLISNPWGIPGCSWTPGVDHPGLDCIGWDASYTYPATSTSYPSNDYWDSIIIPQGGAPDGTDGRGSVLTNLKSAYCPTSYRIYPVPTGDSITVTAGASFDLSCHTARDSGSYVADSSCAVGVTWLDGAGAEISTDEGSTHALPKWNGSLGTQVGTGAASWLWWDTAGASSSAWNPDSTAKPTGSFTSPGGAVAARPFVRFDVAAATDCYSTGFDFRRTA